MQVINENYVSKRIFAKMARKSIYTIDKLIEQGKISQEKDGTINTKYLDLFIRDSILQSSKRGWLYLYPVNVFEFANIDKVVKPSDERMLEVGGIPDVVNMINTSVASKTDMVKTSIERAYRINILREFSTRYSSAVSRQLYSLITMIENGIDDENIKSIADLPIGILIRYIKYADEAALPDDFDPTMLELVHHGNKKDQRNKGLNLVFDDIMKKLELVDEDTGAFLFTREDITPEFLKGKGVLYDSLVSNTNWGTGYSQKDTRDIYEMTEKQYNSLNKRLVQSEILQHGFYVSAPAGRNLKRNAPKYTAMLTQDINEGYYSKIFIVCDEETWLEVGSESVANAIDEAKRKFNIEVSFVNYKDYKKEVIEESSTDKE